MSKMISSQSNFLSIEQGKNMKIEFYQFFTYIHKEDKVGFVGVMIDYQILLNTPQHSCIPAKLP